MLIKWGIGGMIVGFIVGIFYGDIVLPTLAFGIFAIIIRKWIVANLWV